MTKQDSDPFYVGYLPLPQTIRRFLLPWLIGNAVLAIGVASVIAQQRREPGDGVWDTGHLQTFIGIIVPDPYPALITSEGDIYLLVEQGKIGAQARVASLDTSSVYAVKGYRIERDGRSVIEIDGTASAPIAPVESAESFVRGPSKDLGTHTLRGEIVDPKCYLGVMQPGDGKTHKTCATLCISGGIPPMLVVRNTQGETAAYLLTDAEGKPFPESHYGYIADPIELTGRVLREGDLLVLWADLDSIRRLGPRDGL